MGRGIRATRSIPLSTNVDDRVVAHICGTFLSAEERVALHDSVYVIDTSPTDISRFVDLEQHWTGCINHPTRGRCNIRFEGLTLVQISDIAELHPLTVDYGLDFWVEAVSGMGIKQWETQGPAQQSLLDTLDLMYKTVDDYTALLAAQLYLVHKKRRTGKALERWEAQLRALI